MTNGNDRTLVSPSGGHSSLGSGLHWSSVLVGVTTALVATTLLTVLPSRRHADALERQVTALSGLADRLDGSQGGVAAANRLLEALEAQAEGTTAAESVLRRLEDLNARLVAQMEAAERATAVLGRLEALGRATASAETALARAETVLEQVADLAGTAGEADTAVGAMAAVHRELARGGRELQAAHDTARRLVDLGGTLAAEASDADAAGANLDRLVRLKDRLRDGDGLDEAEATLLRLHDLAEWVVESAGTVADLRSFVVDVVLMKPSVERARHTFGPVADLLGRARPTQRAPTDTAGNAEDQAPRTTSATPGTSSGTNGSVTDVASRSVETATAMPCHRATAP